MTLSEKELDKYTDVLIWSLKQARMGAFKKYDSILVRYDGAAYPLAKVLQKKLLSQKFNVILKNNMEEEMSKDFFSAADNKQLEFIPAGDKEFYAALNGLISIRAPQDLFHLKNIPPAKFALSAKARKPIRDIMDKNEQDGKFGWTLCNFPTQILADTAGLSLKEYANQIKKACFLDKPAPVKEWETVFKTVHEICAWLKGLKINELHMESKNIDLRVGLGEKRLFLSGRGCNVPSFEIFTSPDMNDCNGVYYADMPSFRSGNLCEEIKLEFKNGAVVKASAKKGEQYLKKMLAMDEGAKRLGEFSLTDRRFSKINKFMADTLFDENFGGRQGNSHIALGQSFADAFDGNLKKFGKLEKRAYGFNNSALHWDIINTEKKTVTAKLKNGKKVLIYEDGIFKY